MEHRIFGRFAMILLFFSVWAIAIALNEILFSANPFTVHSIISAIPQTLIFSSMLSAAVYLAKNKIMEALHKGRPIDKKFVAEITPEVGHELNKMRQEVADYEQDKRGQWRDELAPALSPENEFQGEEFALAKELFDKLSAAAAQGPIDPNDPDLQKLIEKAKEQGLNIQDIVAIAADQSIPAFPGIKLPDDIPAPDEKPAEAEQPKEPEPEPETLDPSKIAQSQQNIENVLDKYRDLDRLAATPEFKTDGLAVSGSNSAPLTLGAQAVQPIKAVNIEDLERQQSLEQSRRQAKIDVLAQLAHDEDELIAKYHAAAAEGNQLAKAQAAAQAQAQQTQIQAVAQAQAAAPTAAASQAAQANKTVYPSQMAKAPAPTKALAQPSQAAGNNQGNGVTLNSNPSVKGGVSVGNKRAQVADGLNVETIPGSLGESNLAPATPKPKEIYKAQFKKVEGKEVGSNVELDAGANVVTKSELFEGMEGQDQVVNVVDIPEVQTKPSTLGSGIHNPNTKVEPKVRPKDPDAPSLVDTSNLKRYQYVPPKKGAGLDTSALKKVTLPNYNRHDGPSRLSTPNKMGAWNFKPKNTAVSTSSLSNAERQELIARIKKSAHTTQNSGENHERSSGRTLTKKPNWMQGVLEQNQIGQVPNNRTVSASSLAAKTLQAAQAAAQSAQASQSEQAARKASANQSANQATNAKRDSEHDKAQNSPAHNLKQDNSKS